MKEFLNKIKNIKINLLQGWIMVLVYPLYLVFFDYVKHDIITLILTIIFVVGTTVIMKSGGDVVENEKGEKIIKRKTVEPLKLKEVISATISNIISYTKNMFNKKTN